MATRRPVPAEDRASGRVVARLIAFIGISLVAVVVVPAMLFPFARAAHVLAGAQLIGFGVLTCASMLVSTAVTLRMFGESWREATRLGWDAVGRWPLGGGLAAGWFAMVVPAGLLIWIGALRIVPADAGNWWESTGLALALLVPSALTEELAVRGYAFTLLRRAWGASTAVVATSIAFGCAHLLNPGVTVQAVVMVTVAGVFLALVRLAFDSLWAAWIAHVAYNVVQVVVFHTAVSGLALPQPYYRTVSAGPVWLTGGAWGPEGGAAAAFGMFVVSFLLAVYAGWVRIHRRGWRLDIDWRPTGRREP
jgi:membrane protease YdiL (CAAX protease family)